MQKILRIQGRHVKQVTATILFIVSAFLVGYSIRSQEDLRQTREAVFFQTADGFRSALIRYAKGQTWEEKTAAAHSVGALVGYISDNEAKPAFLKLKEEMVAQTLPVETAFAISDILAHYMYARSQDEEFGWHNICEDVICLTDSAIEMPERDPEYVMPDEDNANREYILKAVNRITHALVGNLDGVENHMTWKNGRPILSYGNLRLVFSGKDGHLLEYVFLREHVSEVTSEDDLISVSGFLSDAELLNARQTAYGSGVLLDRLEYSTLYGTYTILADHGGRVWSLYAKENAD